MQRRFLILPVAAAVGLAAEWSGYGWGDPGHWIPDLAVGWCLIGCGFVASVRRPESRSGVLMSATGFTWFLGNFAGVGVSIVAWAAAHALYLHRGPLFHLLLTYPGDRRPSRVTGAAIAVFYAAAVITPVWQSEAATILLAALLPGVCGYEYARMVGPARRMRLIALQAAAGLGFVLAASAIVDLVIAPEEASSISLLAYEVAVVVVAGVLLAGLLLGPEEGAGVADLVLQLGQARSRTLRWELARALGDPALEVGYWLPEAGTFVDASGGTLPLPGAGSDRSATVVERDGRPAAVLIHDSAVLSDQALLDAVAAAVQLESANARLRAEVRAQIAELAASRRRILEAGDRARQRLERRLHDGAERRLAELQKTLYRGRLGATGPADQRQDRARRRSAQAGAGGAAPARSGSASPGSGRTWPGRSPGPAGRRLTRSGGDQRREHPAPFARRGGRLLCLFRRARERCEVLGGIAGGDLRDVGRRDDHDRGFRRWRRRGGSSDGVGADGTRGPGRGAGRHVPRGEHARLRNAPGRRDSARRPGTLMPGRAYPIFVQGCVVKTNVSSGGTGGTAFRWRLPWASTE